jgi:hypothetical protein
MYSTNGCLYPDAYSRFAILQVAGLHHPHATHATHATHTTHAVHVIHAGGTGSGRILVLGFSAIMQAVDSKMRATLLPFSSALRTTFVGSMMPILSMSPYSPVSALKPNAFVLFGDLLEHDGRLISPRCRQSA